MALRRRHAALAILLITAAIIIPTTTIATAILPDSPSSNHLKHHRCLNQILQMSSQPPATLIMCNFCNRTFTREADAYRHFNSQHNPWLDAVCPICLSTWISGARIDRQVAHMRSQHPGLPDRQQWIPGWMLPAVTGMPSSGIGSSSTITQPWQAGNASRDLAALNDYLSPATPRGKYTPASSSIQDRK